MELSCQYWSPGSSKEINGVPPLFVLDADIMLIKEGVFKNLKGAILETIDKILPIAEDLGCRDELIHLGDIVENNQAPYQRQIMQYKTNNEYSEIILVAINDLEKGMVAIL